MKGNNSESPTRKAPARGHGSPVRLRPLGRKHRDTPLPLQVGASYGVGMGEGVEGSFLHFPQSGKDSHLLVLNGNFYTIFLNHKWHGW